jgi:hypothetical protein
MGLTDSLVRLASVGPVACEYITVNLPIDTCMKKVSQPRLESIRYLELSVDFLCQLG